MVDSTDGSTGRAGGQGGTAGTVAVRVWDLPTRLFHWTLAASVVGLVVSGHVGGNALVWHMRLGLLVGALLGFRLVWGLIGGRWSRFAHFVRLPGTVLRYLRGDHRAGDHFDVGHYVNLRVGCFGKPFVCTARPLAFA